MCIIPFRYEKVRQLVNDVCGGYVIKATVLSREVAVMATEQIAITNGPPKFDLMVSLFDRKVVRFTFELGGGIKVLPLTVTSVSAEDGSGGSWILEVTSSDKDLHGQRFYYSSTTRKGTHLDNSDTTPDWWN